MSTIDRTRVVGMPNELLDDFICGICRGILIQPVVTWDCCEHMYCHQCINQWLTANQSCPMDRKPMTTTDLSPVQRDISNVLEKLRVKCEYHIYGCEVVVEMSQLANHLLSCDSNPNKSCTKCGWDGSQRAQHNCCENLVFKIYSLCNENQKLLQQNSKQLFQNSKLLEQNSKLSEQNSELKKQKLEDQRIIQELTIRNEEDNILLEELNKLFQSKRAKTCE